jgi:hypothetical protein
MVKLIRCYASGFVLTDEIVFSFVETKVDRGLCTSSEQQNSSLPISSN